MQRRRFLGSLLGTAAASAISSTPIHAAEPAAQTMLAAGNAAMPQGPAWQVPHLAKMHATPDRIMLTNLCTRPFRAMGPRQEAEKFGRKQVIHNYGHGGSGWSLSWGSAEVAVQTARRLQGRKETALAIIGCGAIGLTTAVMAQRSGFNVTIYTKDQFPNVRSAYATGIWSPESRICTLEHAPGFAASWEQQARTSHRMYMNLMGLPGNPVEWKDMYQLSDTPPGEGASGEKNEPEYPEFTKTLISDITPLQRDLVPGSHPFPAPFAKYYPLLHFNIAHYSRVLMDDFLQAGGRMVITEFTGPCDFAAIDERMIVNCPGYGARALLDDESITPVRGQTCKLIPQPELDYGIRYGSKQVSAYARRDGILVQAGADTDFGNADTTIDPEESIAAVQRLGAVMEETMYNQKRMAKA
jgi:glycine/D-amino acid oxidase-like deaminating enzyme